MSTSKWTCALAVVAVCAVNTNLLGATYYSQQASSTWTTNAHWNTQRDGSGSSPTNPSGGPTSTDDAVIQPGHIMALGTTGTCANLTIEDDASNGGTLNLNSAAVLRVYSSVVTEYALSNHGVFRFNASSGTAPRLEAFVATVILDMELKAPGSLGGVLAPDSNNPTNKFQIQNGAVFTIPSSQNVVTLSGLMENSGTFSVSSPMTISSAGTLTNIGGPATFSAAVDNDGTIRASGTSLSYLVTFSTAPAVGSSGLFEVSGNANAKMVFGGADVTFTNNAGNEPNFLITAGVLHCDYSVDTDDGIRIQSISSSTPKLEVVAGKNFIARGAYAP